MTTAFQPNAFQNNAFQIDTGNNANIIRRRRSEYEEELRKQYVKSVQKNKEVESELVELKQKKIATIVEPFRRSEEIRFDLLVQHPVALEKFKQLIAEVKDMKKNLLMILALLILIEEEENGELF